MRQSSQIEGRRAVHEALAAGIALDRLYLLEGGKGLGELAGLAKGAGAVVVFCDRRRLDSMSATGSHQGAIAVAAAHPYAAPEDILGRASERGEPPFIVVCDGIEDEGNLGSVIRTAEVAGAHGLVVPKRRSAGLSDVVFKASAGAAAHLLVARVPGVPSYLRELKEHGIWVYGTDPEAEKSVYDTDFSGGAAIVIGSEGHGMSRLAAECCDFTVSIPLYGKISSLNVSAAAAVVLCHAARSRSLRAASG